MKERRKVLTDVVKVGLEDTQRRDFLLKDSTSRPLLSSRSGLQAKSFNSNHSYLHKITSFRSMLSLTHKYSLENTSSSILRRIYLAPRTSILLQPDLDVRNTTATCHKLPCIKRMDATCKETSLIYRPSVFIG